MEKYKEEIITKSKRQCYKFSVDEWNLYRNIFGTPNEDKYSIVYKYEEDKNNFGYTKLMIHLWVK